MVYGRHSPHYTPAAGRETRNIVAEAYQTAIKHLERELGISLGGTVPNGLGASANDFLGVVEEAKRKYDEKSKEHTGMRHSLEKISSRIMHYSKVLDMWAQHHPEYVALAWGAVKLVLTIEILIDHIKGIINRANLVQKLSQALVAIANVLPRMDLSADLYRTEDMEAALSRLYAHLILFFHRCVQWYNRSSLGRLRSAITSPFELDYQELVEQIQLSSKAVDDLASAGSRAEIRDVRVLAELQNQQTREIDLKLLEMLERQKDFEARMIQLLYKTDSQSSVMKRIGVDVCTMSQTVFRLEFSGVMQFFEPKVLPETALLKVRSLVRRDRTASLPSPNDQKVRKTVLDWAFGKGSSLLVVQVGIRAQKQAKDLATNVIQNMKFGSQRVFWNLPLGCSSSDAQTIEELFRGIIFQVLQHSGDLFNSCAEQLNLSKVHATHTEREWVDLVCLLFSKLPTAFVIIETEALQKAYRHDPSWSERLREYLQLIADRSSEAGCELKILVALYGNSHRGGAAASSSKNVRVATLQPPNPVPPHLRHVARRSGLVAKGWKIQRPKGQI
ncbi:hypothetical protein J4E80_007167 [Alternaria sp. BMP 0032]|nr:hypothetical protein J4E80_007167 [Alternaria sp. BMP 0032]